MIQVVIRSKRTLSAELLSAAVSAQQKFNMVQLATTDEELFDVIGTRTIHMILFVPDEGAGQSWVEVLKATREIAPRVKLILLTERRDPHVVVNAFRAGARGFFSLQGSGLEMLYKCIERVHDGQIWANSEELDWVIRALEDAGSRSRSPQVVNVLGERLLSQREEDVVQLLSDGMQNREIAQTLNLSEHTIKNYLFRIYDKLGVSSRTELLLYVMNSRSAEFRRVS